MSDTKSEPTLKPCPRCGGPGEIREDYDAQAWSGRYYARCIGAGCGLLSPHFETVALTAAWWNERPGEQVQARLCPSVSSHGFRCQVSEFHLGPHQNGGCQWWDADATIQPEPTRNAAEPPASTGEVASSEKPKSRFLKEGEPFPDYVPCPDCHGSAQCPRCTGTGSIEKGATEPPHQCPYGGKDYLIWPQRACGTDGWLCARCQQDRADDRAKQMTEAITHSIGEVFFALNNLSAALSAMLARRN